MPKRKRPPNNEDTVWDTGTQQSTIKCKMNRVWRNTPIALKVRELLNQKIYDVSRLAHYACIVANGFSLWLLENEIYDPLPHTDNAQTWQRFYVECMKVVRGTQDFQMPELHLYLQEHPWTLPPISIVAPWVQTLAMELGTNARNSLIFHYENQELKTLKRIPEFKGQFKAMIRLAKNWSLGRTTHAVKTPAARDWVLRQRHLWGYTSGDHRRGEETYQKHMVQTLSGKLSLIKLRAKHGVSAMSLLPLRGYGLSHLQVDTRALCKLVSEARKALIKEGCIDMPEPHNETYWRQNQADLYNLVMDLERVDTPSTTLEGKPRWTFRYSFRTDGVSLSLSFNRHFRELAPPKEATQVCKPSSKKRKTEARLEDSSFDDDDDSDHEGEAGLRQVNVEKYVSGLFRDERVIRSTDASALRLCGIDPGRTTLMEAVIQSEDGTRTFQHRLSKRQYYHEGGLLEARRKREYWVKQKPDVQAALNLTAQLSLKQADLLMFHESASRRTPSCGASLLIVALTS